MFSLRVEKARRKMPASGATWFHGTAHPTGLVRPLFWPDRRAGRTSQVEGGGDDQVQRERGHQPAHNDLRHRGRTCQPGKSQRPAHRQKSTHHCSQSPLFTSLPRLCLRHAARIIAARLEDIAKLFPGAASSFPHDVSLLRESINATPGYVAFLGGTMVLPVEGTWMFSQVRMNGFD